MVLYPVKRKTVLGYEFFSERGLNAFSFLSVLTFTFISHSSVFSLHFRRQYSSCVDEPLPSSEV